MAKMKLNPVFAGISGKLGNMVIRKSKNGEVIVSKLPDMSNVQPSPAQLARREAFAKASAYAKSALADETTLAFYKALGAASYRTARVVCMGDYLNAPTIEHLGFSHYHGQVGDRLLIATHDDVGVVAVNVKLTRNDGILIEHGKAVELSAGSGYWEYVATVPVPLGTHIRILTEAFDRPGNRATASVHPIVGESH